jgi:hypothetical protein
MLAPDTLIFLRCLFLGHEFAGRIVSFGPVLLAHDLRLKLRALTLESVPRFVGRHDDSVSCNRNGTAAERFPWLKQTPGCAGGRSRMDLSVLGVGQTHHGRHNNAIEPVDVPEIRRRALRGLRLADSDKLWAFDILGLCVRSSYGGQQSPLPRSDFYPERGCFAP